MPGRFGLQTTLTSALAIGFTATGPALSAQGVGVSDGTAGPVEQAIAIAFILSLPIALVAIGLSRTR